MSRRPCLLSAPGLIVLVCLQSGCSSDRELAGGSAGGTGGSAGDARGGSGTGGSAPSGAAGADAQPGGAGRPGGAGGGGAPGSSFRDAGQARPDARLDAVAANAADGGGALDAAAPDRRLRSDVVVPDGGFRYPDPNARLCGSARHTLSRTPAELLVVLDRSGSMAAVTTPGRTRWLDARDAVIGAVRNAGNLAWGLKVFPSIGTTGSACAVGTGVEVGVGFGHAGPIGNALLHAGPPTAPLGGGTPTEPAILAGTAYLKAVTTALPKYMVLVTDGQPTCAILPNPVLSLQAAALEATIKAMTDAAAAGLKTFVIGMGAAALGANLNRLADAGGMPRAGEPRYYPAENQADLDTALQAISRAVTTCVFPLVTRPLDPDFVGVNVGSMRVPRDLDRIDGWDYANNGTAIEIYGSACDALKTGAAENADIHFGCPE
jgi:hypothetical protein